MLGENRSKPALRGDSVKSVRHEEAPAPEQPDKFAHLKFGPDYPVGHGTWLGPEAPDAEAKPTAADAEHPVEEPPMEPESAATEAEADPRP